MPNTYARRVANFVLSLAIRITPSDRLDWARAMLSELNHVEGDGAALLWAMSGATVLARHALLSAVMPDSSLRSVPLGSELFIKEGSVRKTTLAAVAACVVACLLFFLAPEFRQAFRVSLTSLHDVVHITSVDRPTSWQRQPGLDALARRAEQKHDAEGLAFVAVRVWDASESARLADEAVHLDPSLTWVYAFSAVRQRDLSEINRCVSKLEQWDPQNAVPYLIVAQSIDFNLMMHGRIPDRVDEESPAWQNAMAAAFESPKLDDYLDRLKELDRRVVVRYGFDDPSEVIVSPHRYVSFAGADSRYANSLLDSGKILEAQGDRKGASEKYWAVVRFGRIVMSARPNMPTMMSERLRDAYSRLAELSQKEGNKEQAGLYSDLAGSVVQAQNEERASFRQQILGGRIVSQSNASVVKASGMLMLLFAAVALLSVLSVIAKSRSLRLSAFRISRVASSLVIASVTGMLLSCATLYVSYRPYAEIFREYIRNGNESGVAALRNFLAWTEFPIGFSDFRGPRDLEFYFWFCVAVLCMIALLFVIARYFKSRMPASATI